MPETPDFDQIAEALVHDVAMVVGAEREGTDCRAARGAIAEQLRQVWNARGAADIVTIESELSSMMGVTAGGPYIKNLDRALRRLDQ